MSSRQDQLHSYQFMVQRVVAALVARESDPARSPLRRAAGAALASVLVAAIALGGVAVYGLIVGGGSTDWRDAGAVIVEKESGARFVFRAGRLHPVRNHASALLVIGSAAAHTVLVSRDSIAGVPRGSALGIPDAPDPLPPPDRLVGAPWTLCSVAAAPRPRSVLLVGERPGAGRSLGGAAALVRHPDGTVHLILGDHRHLVRDPETVLPALGWSQRPVPVAAALLVGLPAGADLAHPEIPGRGAASTALPGARVGEVFRVESQAGGRQYAVALRAGLAPITQVQADLLLGDPRTRDRVNRSGPTELSQGEFAAAHRLAALTPPGPGAPPASTPTLAAVDGGALCVVVPDDSGAVEVLVGASVPDPVTVRAAAARSPTGALLADDIRVRPGGGAIVEAVPAPGAGGGALNVVSDLGVRHVLAAPDLLPVLGYAGRAPTRMPAPLVALVPAGGALDPEAARTPVA